MTPEQQAAIHDAVEELDGMPDGDPEIAHSEADRVVIELLVSLGAGEAARAYGRLVDRCSWWATA